MYINDVCFSKNFLESANFSKQIKTKKYGLHASQAFIYCLVRMYESVNCVKSFYNKVL